jgi:hypothetical protein
MMERMERFEYVVGGRPRAPRFPLRLCAQYRRDPSDPWHDATTANVSRSGVLLCTAEPIEPGSTLEISFVLSSGPLDAPLSSIRCRCRIVRVEPRLDAEPGMLVAAAITRYAFRRDTPFASIAH